MLAATSSGLVRLAFEGHCDYDDLYRRSSRSRRLAAARSHLNQAKDTLTQLLAGKTEVIECEIDLDVIGAADGALSPTQSIPWDSHRSYLDLG